MNVLTLFNNARRDIIAYNRKHGPLLFFHVCVCVCENFVRTAFVAIKARERFSRMFLLLEDNCVCKLQHCLSLRSRIFDDDALSGF